MTQIYSNIAHLCNGCAIAYFLLSAWKVKKESGNSYIRRMLSNVLFFWFLLHLKDVIFLNEAFWYDDYISGIVKMVDMLLVPVMFIFFQSCVRPRGLRTREKLFYLLGNVLLLMLYILFPSELLYTLSMLYNLTLGLVAYVTIWRECRQKEKHIEENYSYVEDISPKWIVSSLSALFVCLVSWELLFFWQDTWWGDSVYYLLSIVVWGYIEKQAIGKQEIEELEALSESCPSTAAMTTGQEKVPAGLGKVPTDLKTMPANLEKVPANLEKVPTDLEGQDKSPVYPELKAKLDRLMSEEQLYRKPQLNISELSQALGTNRTYLSALLNGQLGKTFYDYINELRLDHAIRLMQESKVEDTSTYSLKEIAERSGFNSISTFNRQFHSRFGMSPSKWMEKNP